MTPPASPRPKTGLLFQAILLAGLIACFTLPGAFIVAGCLGSRSNALLADAEMAEKAATAAENAAKNADPAVADKVLGHARQARVWATSARSAANVAESDDFDKNITVKESAKKTVKECREAAEAAMRNALAAATVNLTPAAQKDFVDNVKKDIGLNSDQLNQFSQIQSQQIGGNAPNAVPPPAPAPPPVIGPPPAPAPPPPLPPAPAPPPIICPCA